MTANYMNGKRRQANFRLPEPVVGLLGELGSMTGQSQATIVTDALLSYAGQADKFVRLRQEAVAAAMERIKVNPPAALAGTGNGSTESRLSELEKLIRALARGLDKPEN